MAETVHGTVCGLGDRANTAFAVGAVAIPLVALLYSVRFGTIPQQTTVHLVAGVVLRGSPSSWP